MGQDKLVRDHIPQIIMKDGKKPVTRILGQEEYLEELEGRKERKPRRFCTKDILDWE